MTYETTQNSKPDQINYAIGARLKAAREAMGFNLKDVASQLRLNEKVITMLENDTYPNDLPVIFVRGYIRSYGKFVELPDYVIKAALQPVQPDAMHAVEPEAKPKLAPKPEPKPMPKPEPVIIKPKAEQAAERLPRQPLLSNNSKKLVMRSFTLAIAFTLLGMLWMWWHNHTNSNTSFNNISASVKSPVQQPAISLSTSAPAAAHETASQTTSQAPVQTGVSNSGPVQIPLAPQINNALSSSATKPVATGESSFAPVNENDELVSIQDGGKVQVSSVLADNQKYNDESEIED